ncbi:MULTISPECIES: hypothetical protein [unclassified Thioalkalivibrio]|nr:MULTISPECIES: hypothetical protein [unclassified Thioalkalivibrio]
MELAHPSGLFPRLEEGLEILMPAYLYVAIILLWRETLHGPFATLFRNE